MILTSDTLDLLKARLMQPEDVGRQSDWPWVAVRLDAIDPSSAIGLSFLPCPVIGVGNEDHQAAPVCDLIVADEAALAVVAGKIANAPIAAMVLVQHLRASETLEIHHALTVESFAYATVQQGPEFRRWQAAAPGVALARSSPDGPLHVERTGEILRMRLDDPGRRNAIGVGMRDALVEAFDLALADPSIERVELSGTPGCFSTGGDVSEFGVTSDPATAHWIRTLRLPGGRAAQLADRLHSHIDGAAIGAGIEIAAFATHLTATPRSWFQLPELHYGLIPGAGGTISIARRIGRQRTAYLALSGRRIPASRALSWGLIDAIVE